MNSSEEILLSVRLMAYNHESFITKALDGIFAQRINFKVEIVIGDDFSDDNTLGVIKKYISTDNILLKILDRPKNGSYSVERLKRGRLYNFQDIISNCSGKYIALLDGDDYWTDPCKLQKQVDFLEANAEYSICAHNTIMYAENTGELIETPMVDQVYTLKQFILGTLLGRSASSIVFRMDEWVRSKIGSDTFLNGAGGDWMLTVLLLQRGKMKYFGDSMGVYRLHDDGVYSGQQEIGKLAMYLKTAKSVDLLSDRKYAVPIRNRCLRNVIAKIRSSSQIKENYEMLWVLFHGLDKPGYLKAIGRLETWLWFWKSALSKLVYLLIPIKLKSDG